MGCLKLTYYQTTELKKIGCKKVLTSVKTKNKERSLHTFGFNGQEKDNETKSLYFKFREYNPQIVRFWSVDPLDKDYPWNTPYAFAENRVIDGNDLEGLEYQNKTNNNTQGGTYGPLNEATAQSTGATLLPGFKSESQESASKTQQTLNTLGSNISSSQSTIKAFDPSTRPDIARNSIIAQGVIDGLANEGIGLGIGKAITTIGKIEVPLYRAFGGAATEFSTVSGKYFTPINPKLYGKFYSKFAGLPTENSAAFYIKVKTPLNNLNLGSFGLASKIGKNTGLFVPEIKVMNSEAIKIINLRVSGFTNPIYKPLLPIKLP